MPVDTPNSVYSNNVDVWNRCRTVSKGQRFVKAGATQFLPQLGGQDADQYNAYLFRASFFNATGRTVDGLTGVVFRKRPNINFPEQHKEFLESVSLEGSSFESFTRRTFGNVIVTGRHGVLLDIETSIVDTFPYFSGYQAESIINWRIAKVNGKTQLSMVVLTEEESVTLIDDPFVDAVVNQIRVLKLVEQDENVDPVRTLNTDGEIEVGKAFYVVEIWIENPNKSRSDKNKYIIKEVLVPEIRGTFLGYIPFVFLGPIESSTLLQKSMIEDLCDVNLSHYCSSADIEHGRHFTALPTAWVAGFKTDEKLMIGSQTAWVSEDPNANAGFLEYTGQGLGAIEVALETKESQMAILGARMLEPQKQSVEATATHKQRQAGESSVLASAAASVEEGFTILLKWVATWLGVPDIKDIEVIFNKDYMPEGIDPQILSSLMLGLQQGVISWDTYVYNLQRGEMYPEGRTAEEELEMIEERMGNLPSDNLDDDEEDKDEDEDEDEEQEEDEENEE